MVLDTNVVVSAHLNAEGYERFVLDLGLARKVQLFVSPEILTEYDAVLRRPKFSIDLKKLDASLTLIKGKAKTFRPKQKLSITTDPGDNKFLECAQTARADYLVTGNKRHFPKQWKETKVVNAKEFIKIISPELKR
ncbi:putative toxin-antitoxin system toxin component, PIN family [Acidobacteria bacterium AH-259-L09]|nr:putative toxin-antitoxin system toxin component, PIN family [Acidobacteria bacterium AH-259-L09]